MDSLSSGVRKAISRRKKHGQSTNVWRKANIIGGLSWFASSDREVEGKAVREKVDWDQMIFYREQLKPKNFFRYPQGTESYTRHDV